MQAITLTFEEIARQAGYTPEPGGKLNLPANNVTAEQLADAAVACLPAWKPGDPPTALTLTGAGPVWAYLCIAHALHGRVAKLSYAAPNAPDGITIFSHGI